MNLTLSRVQSRLARVGLVGLLARIYADAKEDDLMGAAAELAFRVFLALFPFFIFLASVGGFLADAFDVSDPTEEILGLFGESLPVDVESILRTQIDEVVNNRSTELLSLGFIGTLWTTSGGIGTIMKVANRAYNLRESRPILLRYLLSMFLILAGGLTLVVAFVIFLVGQVYGTRLAEELGFARSTATLITIAQWLIVVLLSFLGTAVLYWLAPDKKLPFRFVTPGSILFVAAWLSVSYGFSLFVARFGSYNATYGTLGGVVITLTWFYLSGLILLLGTELNAVLERTRGERNNAPASSQEPNLTLRSVD